MTSISPDFVKIASCKTKWLNSLQVCWQILSRISQWFRNPVFILVLTRGTEVDLFSLSLSQTPTAAVNNCAVLNHSPHQRTWVPLTPLMAPQMAPLWQDCPIRSWYCHTLRWTRKRRYWCVKVSASIPTVVQRDPSSNAHLLWWEHPSNAAFFSWTIQGTRALTQHMHDSPACLIPARLHSALSRS